MMSILAKAFTTNCTLDLFVYNCNTFIINQCSGFKRIKKMYRVN